MCLHLTAVSCSKGRPIIIDTGVLTHPRYFYELSAKLTEKIELTLLNKSPPIQCLILVMLRLAIILAYIALLSSFSSLLYHKFTLDAAADLMTLAMSVFGLKIITDVLVNKKLAKDNASKLLLKCRGLVSLVIPLIALAGYYLCIYIKSQFFAWPLKYLILTGFLVTGLKFARCNGFIYYLVPRTITSLWSFGYFLSINSMSH